VQLNIGRESLDARDVKELQCVAVRCRALQCIALHCSALRCGAAI